jgi:carbohydrate kinase (thermoresistant glucokinase family)
MCAREGESGVPGRVIVLMGVCGCGKTAVGELLAAQLAWPYYDADDYHPQANVDKMAAGTPLDDADREPWLQRLSELIGDWLAAGERGILGCSALKARYRDTLGVGRPGVSLVYLRGSPQLIEQRLRARQHRYMPAALLQSQFAALEEPAEALVVDIDPPLPEIVRRIASALKLT